MNNSNDEKLLEIIEAFIKVKEGKLKKQSLKKRFGIGAKGYDEMRLNLIKSNHLIHPQAIYTQEEINKLIEGNKELEKLFDDKAKEVKAFDDKMKEEREKAQINQVLKSKQQPLNKREKELFEIFLRLRLKLEKEGKQISDYITEEGLIEDIKNLRLGVITKEDFYHKYLLMPSDFKSMQFHLFIHNQDKAFFIYPLDKLTLSYRNNQGYIKEQKEALGITKKSEVKLELLNNPNIKKEDLINEFILAKDDDNALFSLIERYKLSYFLFDSYREHFVKQEGINPRKLYNDIEIKGVKWLESILNKLGDTIRSDKMKEIYINEKEFETLYTSKSKVKEYQFQSEEGEEPMKQQKQKKNNSTKKELNNKPKEGEKTMSKSSKLQAIQAINQDTPMNTNITKEQKEELVEKGIYDNKQEEAEAKALKEISENLKEVKEEVKALKEEKEKPKKPSNAGRPKWKNEKEKKTAKTLIYTTQELKEKILKYSEKAKQEGLIVSQTGAMSEYITLILETHFAELEKK